MNNRIRSTLSWKPFVVVSIFVSASLLPLRTQAQNHWLYANLSSVAYTVVINADGSESINGSDIPSTIFTGHVTTSPLVESAPNTSTDANVSENVSASYGELQ